MDGIKFQEKILSWLYNNLSYFDPRKDSEIATKSIQLKAFVELIFLYNMFDKGAIFSRNEALKISVEDLINEVIEDIDFSSYSILESGYLPVPAIVEEYKRSLDSSHCLSHKLAEQVSFKLDMFSRKIPYRQLDTKYSLNKAGIESNLRNELQLFGETTLGKLKNQLLLTDDAVYSITHTIFYLTDMGRRDISFLTSKFYNDVFLKLIVYYQLKQNMDILSELVISLSFLKTQLSGGQYAIISSALQYLYRFQDSEQGFVPSPSFTKSCGKEDDFFENYHTTMVALGASYVYEKEF